MIWNSAELKLIVNAILMILTLWSLKDLNFEKKKRFVQRRYYNPNIPKLENFVYFLKKYTYKFSKSGQVIITLALFFIFFNYVVDKKTDADSAQANLTSEAQIKQAQKSRDSIASINDSLQKELSAKADSINISLQNQDSSFLLSFNQEIESLGSVTTKLSDLNESSLYLNHSMSFQTQVQKQINTKTQNLYSVQLQLDSTKKSNDSIRFYLCFLVLNNSFSNAWSIRNPDSATQAIMLANYIERDIERINSQSDNSFLNSHAKLLDDWNGFEEKLYHISFDITGYDNVPVSTVRVELDQLSIGFRSTINNHLSEIKEGRE